jgi:putative endopeptidase
MKYFILLIYIILIFPKEVIGQKSGIEISYMDNSINPGKDFYTYCNGSWLKNTIIPANESRYGTKMQMRNQNKINIKKIYDDISTGAVKSSNPNINKLVDFYKIGMDTLTIDKQGYEPILNQLNQISNIQSKEDFIKLKAKFDLSGIKLLFGYEIMADLKNSNKNAFYIFQYSGGLGGRDFYLEPQFETKRNDYQNYLSKLFGLIGVKENEIKEKVNNVFQFEKLLIENAMTNTAMRDIEKMYNKYTKDELAVLTPEFKWNMYFKELGIKQPDTTIVATVDYFKRLNDLLKSTTVATLKDYATANLLISCAPYLSNDFAKALSQFNEGRGNTIKHKPRWEKIHEIVNFCISDLLAEEYVNRYFDRNVKQNINKIIDNISNTYEERINSNLWLSDSSKKEALRKLKLVTRNIGYPEKWDDYSGLVITKESYWGNICRINAFKFKQNINQLQKPVDRTKWLENTLTVTAYYNPSTNDITFPAAFIQPPEYDYNSDDAANYAGIGSTIGHEFTHGFDDNGVKFDADGNMRMWMTTNDYNNFKLKKNKIIDQFNSYTVIDSLHVNGKLTQGENIAELGGLTIAFYAYKKTLTGKKSKIIDGFTDEQRFFIAYAQCAKYLAKDEELKKILSTDSHTPAKYRVNGILTNFDDFYKAFNVKEGDAMYTPPYKRIIIW